MTDIIIWVQDFVREVEQALRQYVKEREMALANWAEKELASRDERIGRIEEDIRSTSSRTNARFEVHESRIASIEGKFRGPNRETPPKLPFFDNHFGEKSAKLRQLHEKHPTWSPKRLAHEVGCTLRLVYHLRSRKWTSR